MPVTPPPTQPSGQPQQSGAAIKTGPSLKASMTRVPLSSPRPSATPTQSGGSTPAPLLPDSDAYLTGDFPLPPADAAVTPATPDLVITHAPGRLGKGFWDSEENLKQHYADLGRKVQDAARLEDGMPAHLELMEGVQSAIAEAAPFLPPQVREATGAVVRRLLCLHVFMLDIGLDCEISGSMTRFVVLKELLALDLNLAKQTRLMDALFAGQNSEIAKRLRLLIDQYFFRVYQFLNEKLVKLGPPDYSLAEKYWIPDRSYVLGGTQSRIAFSWEYAGIDLSILDLFYGGQDPRHWNDLTTLEKREYMVSRKLYYNDLKKLPLDQLPSSRQCRVLSFRLAPDASRINQLGGYVYSSTPLELLEAEGSAPYADTVEQQMAIETAYCINCKLAPNTAPRVFRLRRKEFTDDLNRLRAELDWVKQNLYCGTTDWPNVQLQLALNPVAGDAAWARRLVNLFMLWNVQLAVRYWGPGRGQTLHARYLGLYREALIEPLINAIAHLDAADPGKSPLSELKLGFVSLRYEKGSPNPLRLILRSTYISLVLDKLPQLLENLLHLDNPPHRLNEDRSYGYDDLDTTYDAATGSKLMVAQSIHTRKEAAALLGAARVKLLASLARASKTAVADGPEGLYLRLSLPGARFEAHPAVNAVKANVEALQARRDEFKAALDKAVAAAPEAVKQAVQGLDDTLPQDDTLPADATLVQALIDAGAAPKLQEAVAAAVSTFCYHGIPKLIL